MYLYDPIDQRIVDERVKQFRDQTRRFLAGKLSEDDFRALRLRNGLYIQRYAPMLRIAIPYGLLSTRQLRKLADISRRYDRAYGHFSTRQNLQLNWPRLEQVPDLRQLHPQHHHRPLRGRGERRDRRLVRVVRDHPAVVDVQPRVQLPAAQVQDRRERVYRGSSRSRGA